MKLRATNPQHICHTDSSSHLIPFRDKCVHIAFLNRAPLSSLTQGFTMATRAAYLSMFQVPYVELKEQNKEKCDTTAIIKKRQKCGNVLYHRSYKCIRK